MAGPPEKPRTIGAVLEQSQALAAPDRVDPDLWRRAVGSKIAEQSTPKRIQNGTLTVGVRSSAWANELSLYVPLIRSKLAALGVQVDAIRFVAGSSTAPGPRESSPILDAPNPTPLPEELSRKLQEVDDGELRAKIAEAASYALGRLRNDR